jgi:hypothetical protein
MFYAHVTNGTVDALGQPPQTVFYENRWWDLRDSNPTMLAWLGWYPVQLTSRPADTATTSSEAQYDFNGTGVLQTWNIRPKTQQELDATQVESTRQTLMAQLTSGVNAIQDARDAAQNDTATADILRGQADALAGQITTHITQMQAFNPNASYSQAQMVAMRDAIIAIAQRQRQIAEAMSGMYQYRKAVNENAVTTDNALLWIARLISDNFF